MHITREQAIGYLATGESPSKYGFELLFATGNNTPEKLEIGCIEFIKTTNHIRIECLKALGVTQQEIDDANSRSG